MTDLAKRIASNWLRSKTAGAEEFEVYVRGTNADRAFSEAQDDGQAESGSRGYSGTIAEKPGYRFLQDEPVTQDQARDLIDDAPSDDKWGDAWALKIGEEKVVATKDATIKVKARNAHAAQKAVKELVKSKTKVRRGAKLVVLTGWRSDPVRPGGMPELVKAKGTQAGFVVAETEQRYPTLHTDTHALKRSKKEAVAQLKAILKKARKGAKFSIWKIQEQDTFTVTADSSKLPSWEIPVIIKQVQVGKPIGFIFWGSASS